MTRLNKFKKNLKSFGKEASVSAIVATANGAHSLGKRACIVGKETFILAKAVHQKNTAQQRASAEKIVDETLVKSVKGIAALTKQAGKLVVQAADCALEKNPALKDKKLHNTLVGAAVITGTIASAVMLGDAISSAEAASPDYSDMIPQDLFLPTVDVNNIFGVDNHIVGPNADIQGLSDLGMRPEFIDNHIESDSIERSAAAKSDFLHTIGLDSIPQGYEIHHVVPLSQGGLDIPSNMVLITEEAHDFITAQHRQFYGW